MKNPKTHKVILTPRVYDIISADSEFYAFIGKRLDYTFDRFICDTDKNIFYEHANTKNTERFVVKMISENGADDLFCLQLDWEKDGTRLVVFVANIAELVVSDRRLVNEVNDKNRLLELCVDYIFVYDPSKSSVVIYSSSINIPEVVTYNPRKTINKLKENVPESDYEAIDEFVISVKNGVRKFELVLDNDILKKDPAIKYTQIKGASIYKDGKFSYSVGYIRQGTSKMDKVKKSNEIDTFTGLLAKNEIINVAVRSIDIERRESVSLVIIDIDCFKRVNDTFGHLVGDEIIKGIAAIIEKEVGNRGIVGRFGGDEFFVVFFGICDMERCREVLRGIKSTVNATYATKGENKPHATVSMGCASFPKDADNYEDVFTLADFALYRAKEKGRNRYVIYDKEKHGTLDEIKNSETIGGRINNRGSMSLGDILCTIADKVYNTKDYFIEDILEDFSDNMEIERIVIYVGQPYCAKYMVGEKIPDKNEWNKIGKYLSYDEFMNEYDGDILKINNIDTFFSKSQSAQRLLKKYNVLSLLQIKFKDKNGIDCILSLEAVNKTYAWNDNNMYIYRLMAKLLSEYALT